MINEDVYVNRCISTAEVEDIIAVLQYSVLRLQLHLPDFLLVKQLPVEKASLTTNTSIVKLQLQKECSNCILRNDVLGEVEGGSPPMPSLLLPMPSLKRRLDVIAWRQGRQFAWRERTRQRGPLLSWKRPLHRLRQIAVTFTGPAGSITEETSSGERRSTCASYIHHSTGEASASSQLSSTISTPSFSSFSSLETKEPEKVDCVEEGSSTLAIGEGVTIAEEGSAKTQKPIINSMSVSRELVPPIEKLHMEHSLVLDENKKTLGEAHPSLLGKNSYAPTEPPQKKDRTITREALAEWDAIDQDKATPYPSYLFHSQVLARQWAADASSVMVPSCFSSARLRGASTSSGMDDEISCTPCLKFSPRGDVLLVGFKDGVLWYIAMPTHSRRREDSLGEESRTESKKPLRHYVSSLGSVHLSSGFSTSAPKDLDKKRAWRIEENISIREERLSGHTGGITCLAFSDSGEEFATSAVDQCLILWNTSTRSKLRRITFANRAHTLIPRCVVFAPNNNNYCIVCFRGHSDLQLFNTSTGLPVVESPTSLWSTRKSSSASAAGKSKCVSITVVTTNASLIPFVFTGDSEGEVSLWTSFHLLDGYTSVVPLLEGGSPKHMHRSINQMRLPQFCRSSSLRVGEAVWSGIEHREIIASSEICGLAVLSFSRHQAHIVVPNHSDKKMDESKRTSWANDDPAWLSALISSMWKRETKPMGRPSVSPERTARILDPTFKSPYGVLNGSTLCAIQVVASTRNGNVYFIGIACHQKNEEGGSKLPRVRSREPSLLYSLVPLRCCSPPDQSPRTAMNLNKNGFAQMNPPCGFGRIAFASDSDRLIALAYLGTHSVYIVTPSGQCGSRDWNYPHLRRGHWTVQSCLEIPTGGEAVDVAWSPDPSSRYIVVTTEKGAVYVWERLYLLEPYCASDESLYPQHLEDETPFNDWNWEEKWGAPLSNILRAEHAGTELAAGRTEEEGSVGRALC